MYCRDQPISLFPDRTKETGKDAGTGISGETVEKVQGKKLEKDQITGESRIKENGICPY